MPRNKRVSGTDPLGNQEKLLLAGGNQLCQAHEFPHGESFLEGSQDEVPGLSLAQSQDEVPGSTTQ